MGTWTTETTLEGTPEHVLGVLTEPAACARFSPVPFEVGGLTAPTLETGTRARLGGRIGGRSVEFDLDVLRADDRRLELRARGPIEIEARYAARAVSGGTRLVASVSVHGGRGLRGCLVARLADAVLAAGALDQVVARVADEVTALPGVAA